MKTSFEFVVRAALLLTLGTCLFLASCGDDGAGRRSPNRPQAAIESCRNSCHGRYPFHYEWTTDAKGNRIQHDRNRWFRENCISACSRQ